MGGPGRDGAILAIANRTHIKPYAGHADFTRKLKELSVLRVVVFVDNVLRTIVFERNFNGHE